MQATRMGMRSYLCVLFLALTCFLSGCIYVGNWGPSDAFRTDFHSNYAFRPNGVVTVESFNGSIQVAGWDQNAVEVNGTKHASYRSLVDAIKVDVNATPESIRIRAVRPDPIGGAGVHFSIRVPRDTTLQLISSSNGRLDVDSVNGNARLKTSNGQIRVSRLKGEVDAETSNATIEAQELTGDANLHTSNGRIRASASGGAMEATTSNGRIEVRLTDPATNRTVRLHSSNGSIELTLDGKELPAVRAVTSNSSILVRLPPFANARVEASTSHSAVSSDFSGLAIERGQRRTHSEMAGTIGQGGPLLDLQSSNGPIKIVKF